jgi:hypothetical protein
VLNVSKPVEDATFLWNVVDTTSAAPPARSHPLGLTQKAGGSLLPSLYTTPGNELRGYYDLRRKCYTPTPAGYARRRWDRGVVSNAGNKVSFYDSRLAAPARPAAAKVPLPTLPSRGRMIIAFAAGYDD